MADLRELQKQEALERLKILQEQYELMETVVNEFEKEDVVYYSEYTNKRQQGILYWISNNEEYVNAIKEFEEKYKALVYHAILTPMEFGTLLNLLCVCQYEEEWERERQELKDGYPFVYCMNLDDSSTSEFGTIQIAGANGGITRIN